MLKDSFFVIKIGGSVLTDKNNPEDLKIDFDTLTANFKAIREYCRHSNKKVLICNGAGNYGHTKAKLFLKEVSSLNKNEIELKLEEIHKDVIKLHNVVKKIAINEIGIDNILGFEFGDVDFDGHDYIVSTEVKIFNYLQSQKLESDFIIFLSDQDGIYFDFQDKEKGLIKKININNTSFEINFQKSSDATGGMQQKLEKAIELMRFTKKIWIINGKKAFCLKKLLNQSINTGTEIYKLSD
jgi:isopentenyl phosphate kinase